MDVVPTQGLLFFLRKERLKQHNVMELVSYKTQHTKAPAMSWYNFVEVNPYPTAFPYGNGMVLHFYQQQESSTTKTVHKVINKRLKAYV